MTSFDDLTDSSPESPQDLDVPDDPGAEADLGNRNADAVTGDEGASESLSDAERGNLDGSTPHEATRADSLDESREAVRDPSEAGPERSDLGSDIDYDPQSADAGDSGQDNGLNG